jgi:ribokinase
LNVPDVVFVGSPSLDRIRISGATHDSVGGAGFMSALAARLSGATVGLVARVPPVLPVAIAPAFAPGGLDPGGLRVGEGELPSFHISYDAAQHAVYDLEELGVEIGTRAGDVPPRWLSTRWIHVSPIGGGAREQLRFVRGLRNRGYTGSISLGTYVLSVRHERDVLEAAIREASLIFLNREEFEMLFGNVPDPPLDVAMTMGSEGVRTWDGRTWAHFPATATTVVDPTGAGDAFCGGYLGSMVTGGTDPVSRGLTAAATVLSGVGARPLIDALPKRALVEPHLLEADPNLAAPDPDRIIRVGRALRPAASTAALDFCGFPFPEQGDPMAGEILALATLHQYGFWTADEHGYTGPLWAVADGRRFKGSDYVWQAFTRAAAADPAILEPERLASDPLLFDRICRDDDGRCPVPDVGTHRALQQAYGEALERRGGFVSILEKANSSAAPTDTLLEDLRSLPGYGEDPLAKKATLLALILGSRPERLLQPRETDSLEPIVDYHLMRACLRTGAVRVSDDGLRRRLVDRAWVSPAEEASIRSAAYEAIQGMCASSGLGVAEVDGFFFSNGRRICLETETPHCDRCPIAVECVQDIDLFQPIYRTTAY